MQRKRKMLYCIENYTLLAKDAMADTRGLIDCACPSTVAGSVWMKNFLGSLSEEWKQVVVNEKSQKVYKFGSGETRDSKGSIVFPCNVANKDIRIRTDVIEADLPLLIGNTTLEKAEVILDLGKKKATILGEQIKLHRADSGHFMVDVKHPIQVSSEKMRVARVNEHLVLLAGENKASARLDEKSLRKIHHYLGHAKPEKLKKLIRNAGLLNSTVESVLQKIGEDCSCRTIENRRPKPILSIPKADKHNQVVSMDLKEWKDGELKHILYLVDVFSRFVVACYIKDKEPSTIVEAIIDNWIRFFGRMEAIMSDRGGEFQNEEVAKLCEYLDVKHLSTAAYSPNMNGINERNHAICDHIRVATTGHFQLVVINDQTKISSSPYLK